MATHQLCTFYLDKMHLGIDVSRVQEVIRYQALTAVPLAPEGVRGLMNLRGQIVTALDLRQRLGLGSLPMEAAPMNVVVHGGDGLVSLLVDAIDDVVEVDAANLERPPSTLSHRLKSLVSGVFKREGGLLLWLDADRVTEVGDGKEVNA